MPSHNCFQRQERRQRLSSCTAFSLRVKTISLGVPYVSMALTDHSCAIAILEKYVAVILHPFCVR